MFIFGVVVCALGLGIGFATLAYGVIKEFKVEPPLVPVILSVTLWLFGFILCCSFSL